MTALPSVGGHGSLHLLYDPDSLHDDCSNAAADSSPAPGSSGTNKRKRRPAGTPDPGAEVVALSPKTLMESDRYICEICNQGFQRDQNLQMHRRRHKVPWKLLKKPSLGTHKRVYVCPELSCLHHDPSHALGDLVGIKKHYRRKHCIEKQWKCDRCSKGYAVQSDYKAHLKTCGTRGHCCDCGRVFSRVESFIEHQDTCRAVRNKNNMQEGGSDRNRNSRNLSESPSQSSDTTQAITLAHSGISNTTARSLDSSRLINEPTPEFNNTPVAIMPLWLLERRNELQLLPWKRQSPDSYSEALQTSGTMHDIRREVSGARSQVTRCSSISSPCPEVSFSDSKSLPPSLTSDDANTPSLQLSIGPYSTEVASENDPGPCEIDTKPSSAEREAVAITYEQRQPRGGEASGTGSGQRGYSGRGLGKDLALSFPGVHGAQPGVDVSGEEKTSLSLNDFLIQATRRLGPPKSENRPSSSQSNQPEQPKNTHVEMASTVTLVGSTRTSHHGERERGQDSDSLMLCAARKGSLQQPQAATEGEPANLNFFRKQAHDRTEVAETELFAASRSVEEAAMQREIAAAAHVEAIQAREQARTDINKAWSDMAAARRTKEQARQESNVAQKELGRADLLKKEAREQLQLASTEKAYADHAREIAKRHMDMAEAELANAKRLREHAQTEMENAQLLKQRAEQSSDSQLINATGLCQSCKGPIGDRLPSQTNQTNRTTYTSSVNIAAPSWPIMTAAPAALTSQSSRGESQLHYMSSGSSSLERTEIGPDIVQGHKRVLSLMMLEAPRIPRTSSWPVSEPGAALPESPSANSSRWMSHASSSYPIYATSMAVEGTPQRIQLGDQSGSSMGSGRAPSNPPVDQLEPLGSPKQLDLN